MTPGAGAETGSGRPLPAKLGITGPMTVALIGGPPDADVLLGPLPPGVTVTRSLRRGRRVEMIVCFVTERRALERRLPGLLDGLGDHGTLWLAWPKKTSGVPSDLSDEVVRATVVPSGWVDTKVCAIDATWSGLKFVLRRALRQAPRERTNAGGAPHS